MIDTSELIEEPAPPPRPWRLIIFLVATPLWCLGVVLSLVFPEKNNPRSDIAGYMLIPLTAMVIVACAWEVVSRVRRVPYRPAVCRREGECLEFRFSRPLDTALAATTLAAALAFVPLVAVLEWWGPQPWPIMALAPAPLMAVAFVVGYCIGRAVHARGGHGFLLAGGRLTLPAKRDAGGWYGAHHIDIRDVQSVVLTSTDLALVTIDRAVRLAQLQTYEEGYQRGRWLADVLGVPLVRWRIRTSPFRTRWKGLVLACLPLVYFILVVSSFATELLRADTSPAPGRPAAAVPAFDGGRKTPLLATVTYDDFGVLSNGNLRAPILLLHGSPGRARDLADMARAFQSFGYRVLTPDLPGFGDSTRDPPSLSILSHAHQMLALMDQLKIPRAHIIGWSLGGGVGMHMADLAPDRVASLTLMASISDQQVEGTRSYVAEHAKYAAGYLAATVARYAIPHFGYLSHLDDIRNSMRNFWDTDMRPLTAIMQRMTVPTMILHGRHDFLVPAFAAEHSHSLIGPSRLVITEHSHFYPFLQPELAAAHIRPLLARHDEPGIPALRQRADLSPEPLPLLGTPGRAIELALRQAHWLTLTLGGILVLLWSFRTGAILLFITVACGFIDNGIAFAALAVFQTGAAVRAYRRGRRLPSTPRIIGRGTSARTPSHWRDILAKHPIRVALGTRFIPGEHDVAFEAIGHHRLRPVRFLAAAFVAWCLWMLLYFILSIACFALVISPVASRLGLAGFILGLLASIVLIRSFELLLTRHGRRRPRMSWTRLTHREYWPAELLYYPMAPFYIYWGLRYGPIAFTACNPGIDSGGGVIGESKKDILDAMPDAAPWILQSVRIDRDPSPDARADRALAAIAANPVLHFPVILKPDSGYRGFAVKLARDESDVRDYFQSMHAPAIMQEYHPGPCECGILWARHVNPSSSGDIPGEGRIFSITRKTFPTLTGDGRRSLEHLIHRHPRFHAQAGIFLERWAADRGRILAAGEALRLAESGNHCQGTLFTDGEDLITSELIARIDVIARSFRGGLDIGRFDLRYESDEQLRRGEGFRIIELNGVTGESTNMYDPNRSLLWAFGVATRQWHLMYQLGAARVRAGHRPLPVRELFRHIRDHKRSRSGPSLAD